MKRILTLIVLAGSHINFQPLLLIKIQFFNNPAHSGVSVQSPQDEPDVDAYAFVIALLTPDVAREGLLVSIEGQTDDLSLRIQHRTT